MSKFTQILATTYSVTINASEEASRFGVHSADIDHIFLALVIDEGTAGQVLRRAGITLDAARTAVATQHREHLESLGVQAELPGDGQIRLLEQGGIEWTERATALISRASGKGKAGDAMAILREVLTEPSGTIEDVLARLGTAPDELLRLLDAASRIRERDADPARRLGRTHRVFVPATPADAWALVSDAARLPEWDATLASVTEEKGSWVGSSINMRADGKPLKVRPGTERQLIERVSAAHHRVEWLFTYPDAPTANQRSVIVALEEAAGGSQVTVDYAWIRGSGPRGFTRAIAPVTRVLMRPLVRLALWFQVTHLTGGISRALR